MRRLRALFCVAVTSQSDLLHKLTGTQNTVAGAGETMPYGGPYLSQDDMDTIGAWILEGAPDN